MMQGVALRKLVSTIGLTVAITTAVATPSVYLIHDYYNVSEHMAFKARLNAARVAQYIYAHGDLWQYQQLRLTELIQLPEIGARPIRQKIYDRDKRLVLEEGAPVAAPIMTRSIPIVVAGSTVGDFVVEESLRKTLYETGLVAFISALIGFGAYFALRVFPLRVLDRTLGDLHETQRRLAAQNERFDTALTHMSQGLVMFDASAHMVVFNQRYIDMFGLSRDIIKPGASLRDVLHHRVSTGGFSADEVDDYMAGVLAAVREGNTFSKITKLPDGRTISIVNQPTVDGGWVATHEDITERLLAEEKIRHLAHYDALTDLPNRVKFYDWMETALARMRRSENIAVLSLDLDHFKNVNDTLGHPAGDRLLQVVAERMRACVRAEDLVARLGGDEFAIVQVSSAKTPNIAELAARVIEQVGASYDIDGHQVVVGGSIGIAIAPGDGKVPDVIMKNADLALYRAKADGGGVYRFFEVGMDARMRARSVLELDLRKAIVNGEFELYYQPIVDVKSGHATGCEALVRWHHPERGLVLPGEFIALAEETGLIVPLGEWILRQACAAAARWPKHVTVAVNLSPAQFKSRNMVQTVISALAASGLAAGRLELEITELVLLQETEGAFAILHQLRELGIRIAMDDFGTGYSSLGYLRSFPFDKIKIDQSFIRDLTTKEDSVAIIRAVVGLSSSMGITTTAEGVETKDQLARLTAEGCNEVQGYLFSPPLPAGEIERALDKLSPRIEAVA
ncbi:MAG: EAL domain-containing protein [Rhizobiales bacterium]|nr:EAL domain-containing protein [Hyphomicrobiales bacterium]